MIWLCGFHGGSRSVVTGIGTWLSRRTTLQIDKKTKINMQHFLVSKGGGVK